VNKEHLKSNLKDLIKVARELGFNLELVGINVTSTHVVASLMPTNLKWSVSLTLTAEMGEKKKEENQLK